MIYDKCTKNVEVVVNNKVMDSECSAISSCETSQDCSTANHVVFYHLSAKDVGQHSLCPHGEESWCFVQRAEALGKEPEPCSIKKLYLSNIPGKQLELVKGVYKDLANPALLQKCFSGRIQNPNESLHSKVWRKVSKDKYAGLHRTCFCVSDDNLGAQFWIL